MIRFAKMVNPDYDFYKRSGFRRSTPISVQDAADRIVVDMLHDGYYIDLIETLIHIDHDGYMGHRYRFRGLDDAINDVIKTGFYYDAGTGKFFEDHNRQVTRNWGRLLEGDERPMAVLRLDIAGNTKLVKENSKQLIDKAYKDLREIVKAAVVSRLGRLWIWEGDGSLGAFMLGNYSGMAVYAGIEILNEMFIYNKMKNPLKSAIDLRLAVHLGDIIYSNNDDKCLKSDVVKKTMFLESKAAEPNSFVISESLAMSQNESLINIFSDVKKVSLDKSSADKYRIYQVRANGS